MFSKELLEMDRNTVLYMIDEMQNEIDEQREEIECLRALLKQADIQVD